MTAARRPRVHGDILGRRVVPCGVLRSLVRLRSTVFAQLAGQAPRWREGRPNFADATGSFLNPPGTSALRVCSRHVAADLLQRKSQVSWYISPCSCAVQEIFCNAGIVAGISSMHAWSQCCGQISRAKQASAPSRKSRRLSPTTSDVALESFRAAPACKFPAPARGDKISTCAQQV